MDVESSAQHDPPDAPHGLRTPRCRCAHLPDERGRLLPQAWVALHDEVRLVATDGRRAAGWTAGLDVASGPLGREAVLAVEVDAGDNLILPLQEIATCTPTRGITDPASFVTAVRDAAIRTISTPSATDGELRLILDDHSSIEFTWRRAEHPCLPGT